MNNCSSLFFMVKLFLVISMIRLENIKIYEDLDKDVLFNKVLKRFSINKDDVINMNIIKKSIDARDKKNVFYNYSFNVNVYDESKYSNLKIIDDIKKEKIKVNRNSSYSPVIIGSGPAGLFCALTLIKNGVKPIIIEQGSCVEDRVSIIEDLKNNRKVNTLCNVQFGEGGAGTFSDGKLTTGINSPYIRDVLEMFYEFGAPEEILYLNKPHIGTDNLRSILVNIRKFIEDNGGKYYFNTKMIDFKKMDNLIEVYCSNDLSFITDSLVLAIGHSARDTYKLLVDKDVNIVRKNFSVGVRIEHKQKMINESQYGTFTKLNLPPAEYKLVYHNDDRSCYTFCMCPGGEVVASSSEEESIVTNGMSVFKRDKENANSALLVNVMTSDFEGDDPLAGMYFQEKLEHDAFLLGGSNYNAPIQRVEDFIKDRASSRIGEIVPSYKPGYTLCNLHDILPDFVYNTLKEGIIAFDKKIKGFACDDAILTGVETRSSSPVTILRNEDLESSISCVYPCGEGAGFAGGITSSAIDGMKVAIKILEK